MKEQKRPKCELVKHSTKRHLRYENISLRHQIWDLRNKKAFHSKRNIKTIQIETLTLSYQTNLQKTINKNFFEQMLNAQILSSSDLEFFGQLTTQSCST